MTDAEKLARVKAILDKSTTTEDALLGDYIKEAGYFILSVTRQPLVPLALEGAQVDIAVSAYTKRGAEGESTHSEGGVSVTYESLSSSLQALLRSHSLAGIPQVNSL